MRFVVPTKDDCYSMLGAIHSCAKPISGYMQDYIATPKSNGYRSLNTLVEYKNTNMQARIRSVDMERFNRLGLVNEDNPAANNIVNNIRESVNLINKTHPSDKEFLLAADQNILRPTIIVRSPAGKRIVMHDGQTALDYALISGLVKDEKEIDKIYVNGIKYNYNVPLCDDDLVFVLRKGK